MESLLPPNASPLERALEKTTYSTYQLPLNISDAWDPDKCPEHMLPFLAWSYSVDTWNDAWPEQVKREQIKMSLDIHKRKGTVYAVKQAVKAFGSEATLRLWFEKEPKGEPHTFEVWLSGGLANDRNFQADIIRAIDAAKGLRDEFTAFAGLEAEANVHSFAKARAYQLVRLSGTTV